MLACTSACACLAAFACCLWSLFCDISFGFLRPFFLWATVFPIRNNPITLKSFIISIFEIIWFGRTGWLWSTAEIFNSVGDDIRWEVAELPRLNFEVLNWTLTELIKCQVQRAISLVNANYNVVYQPKCLL